MYTKKMNTAVDRLRPTSRLLLFLCAYIATLVPVYSQYSDETFSLKKASEQYDERGFLKGQIINVDGKLAVSNVNGGVSYSYSLDKFTQKGYSFNVGLNYCNSVTFSSFKDYHTGTIKNGTLESPDYWDKFTRNRPLWIIGVNGFAVQTFSLSSDFMGPKHDSKKSWDDTEMPWLIEGYDFCNRMNRMEHSSQYDIIRLLRADGSVLELRNPYRWGQEGGTKQNYEFVTGHYFEDAMNATGTAVVEFDTTRLMSNMQAAVREFVNGALGQLDSNYWKKQLYQQLPRRVRYLPGDGLEYVFVEHQLPFGWEVYDGEPSITGGKTAGPTIFYLKEINDASGVVMELRYSRHESPGDGSPGRALIREIGDHVRFRYGDLFVTVEAHGRTTTMQLEKTIPFSTFDERGGDYHDKKTYIGMVRNLRDPESRLTEFSYENYKRIFRDYKHPYTTADYLHVNASRLISIKEPAAHYTISYHEGADKEIFYRVGEQPNGAMADWRLNPTARTVTKYNNKHQWLTAETYCFDGLTGTDPGVCSDRVQGNMPRTVVRWKDRRTQKEKTTTYIYQRLEADRYRGQSAPDPLAIPLAYTALLGVEEEADNKVVATRTHYARQSNGALILPVKTEGFVRAGNSETAIRTSLVKTNYITRAGHGYGGPHAAAGMYTLKIEKKSESVYNPQDSTEVLLTNVTEQLNLPYIAIPQQVAQVVWDKLASLKRYDSLYKAGILTCYWEDMPDSLHIFDTLNTRLFTAPPFYGLIKEKYRLDDQGRYLGGTKTVYEQTSRAPGQNRRGLPLCDSLIAEDRASAALISETRYGSQLFGLGTYGWAYTDERLPVWRCDANGAVSEVSYRFASRGIPYAIRLNDDSTTQQQELRDRLFALGLEKPLIEKKLVRNAQTGATDTLQTRNEWTFFGLLSGQSDFNGYYSRFEYDKNGRLSIAQLPKDFLGTQTTCLERFEGAKEYKSPLTWTHSDWVNYIVRCPGDELIDTTRHIGQDYMNLTAGIHYSNGPCPPEYELPGGIVAPASDEVSVTAGKRGREEVLTTSGSWSIETYTHDQRDIAICRFDVTGADNLFAAAQTIRYGSFRFFISSMQGRCFTMEVIARRNSDSSIMARRTYVMNCSDGGDISGGFNGGKTERIMTPPSDNDRLFSISYRPEELQSIRQCGAQGFVMEIRVQTPGARINIVNEGEDKRPHWHLDGVFNLPVEQKQFTMAYQYSVKTDDAVIQRVKTDDRYTAVNYSQAECRPMRYMEAHLTLGGDKLLEKSRLLIGDPTQPIRIDSTTTSYTGAGLARKVTDQEGFEVQMEYDARGRTVKVINADSTYSLITYEFGHPGNLPWVNEEFYGYYERVVTKIYDRQGVYKQGSSKYYDALGRLRVEEIGEGLNLQTIYSYDRQNRLTTVVNANGDTTAYWYDEYGRIRYKYQPDMGYSSYSYDALGQVRFIQTQQQANNGELTFTQYDDLGRVTLVGETRLFGEPGGGGHGIMQRKGEKREQVLSVQPPAPRLTDALSGKYLHDGGMSTVVTANRTVWLPTWNTIPQFWTMGELIQTTCVPQPLTAGGVSVPFLMHPVQNYNDPGLPLATVNDFEDIARFPQNARTVVQYDEMPPTMGSVWFWFPNRSQWDALAPTGRVRNQKGQEAAIAYRQHAGEPYHYIVMSYDERGRMEALLRYTENLGFDAVYYTYNSMNTLTSVRVVDPLRQQTTWYGYDWNGRVDSVWTKLSAAGSGLGVTNPVYRRPEARPIQPDIVYSYEKRGHVDKMKYPRVVTEVSYHYNARGHIDTLLAEKNGTLAFRQALTYNALGRITGQTSIHSGQSAVAAEYMYDYQGQLINAIEVRNGMYSSRSYTYDDIGNRIFNLVLGTQPERNAFTYADPNGPNRLSLKRDSLYQNGVWTETGYTSFAYNANGSMTGKTFTSETTMIDEVFGYDNVQGVMKKYVRTQGQSIDDWRYRYSTSGDREQKRLYSTTQQPVKEWYYYLLGADKKQLAVYKGIETGLTSCGPTVGNAFVYLYPTEYLVYGATDVHNITYRPVDPVTSRKDYKIQDMLGSTRVVVEDNGQGGMITGRFDYEPYGKVIWSNAPKPRLAFIDREQDSESKLGSFGQRQYDEGTERFNTIDPLWEKYRGLTPYHYAANSPLIAIDRGGDSTVVITSGPALSASYYSLGLQGLVGHVAIGDTELGVVFSFEGDGKWQVYPYDAYVKGENQYRDVVEQTVNVDRDKVWSAIEESREMKQQQYNTETNSCVTQSICVLRAGGLPIKDPGKMSNGGAITPEVLVSFLNKSGLVTNTKTHASGTVSSTGGNMLFKMASGVAWLFGAIRIEDMYDGSGSAGRSTPGVSADAP